MMRVTNVMHLGARCFWMLSNTQHPATQSCIMWKIRLSATSMRSLSMAASRMAIPCARSMPRATSQSRRLRILSSNFHYHDRIAGRLGSFSINHRTLKHVSAVSIYESPKRNLAEVLSTQPPPKLIYHRRTKLFNGHSRRIFK